MSIQDLLDGVGEIQGPVVVRQWNEDTERYDFEEHLWALNTKNKILDAPIKFMYANTNPFNATEVAIIIEI